jgi:hypothetical protein
MAFLLVRWVMLFLAFETMVPRFVTARASFQRNQGIRLGSSLWLSATMTKLDLLLIRRIHGQLLKASLLDPFVWVFVGISGGFSIFIAATEN